MTDGPTAAYRKILVAVDGSPAADKGLREAIRRMRSAPVPVLLVRAAKE